MPPTSIVNRQTLTTPLSMLPTEQCHAFAWSQSRRLSSSSAKPDMAGFALWSSVASPVYDDDEEEDDVIESSSEYVLQVKAYVTKNEGTAIGFYCFEPRTSDEEHIGGCAYFDLNRNAFEAYYSAILSSLDYVNQHEGVRSITVQCDHDTVVHQLNGRFDIQRETLRSLYWKVMEMKEERFDNVRFEFIPSNQNKQAGELASKALGSKTLTNYHFDMIDPMRTMAGQAAGASRTKKSTKGSRLSKTAKETNGEQGEDSFDETDSIITDEEALNVPDNPVSALMEQRRAMFMDIFESLEDEETAHVPSPSIFVPNGPSIYPNHTYILEFDGGSRGNPSGVAGAGMVLYDAGSSGQEKHEVWAGWDYLGKGKLTNNQAEYSGLIGGLEAALARGVRKIVVFGDSNLVVKHISGEYRVRNEKLKPLWKKTKELLEKFDSYEVKHIRRHLNSRADGLANLAMDNRESGSSD